MEVVKSLKEAMDFFLGNSRDNCLCVDGDREKEVECYPDAQEFFEDGD